MVQREGKVYKACKACKTNNNDIQDKYRKADR